MLIVMLRLERASCRRPRCEFTGKFAISIPKPRCEYCQALPTGCLIIDHTKFGYSLIASIPTVEELRAAGAHLEEVIRN